LELPPPLVDGVTCAQVDENRGQDQDPNHR
jgi:hypothetical protein